MLLNIHTCEWDEEFLKLFDIPKSLLPEVKPSSKIYGVTGGTFQIHVYRLPVLRVTSRLPCSGKCATQPGMVKNTYGTGCFMLMNTGEKAIASKTQSINYRSMED